MRKRIFTISLLVSCLLFVSFIYLKNDNRNQQENIVLENVVFQDLDQELVPVFINFHSNVDLEQNVRNKIDLMKSNEMIQYGLYPIFNDKIEIQSVELKQGIMTVSFNSELRKQKNALDVIETLAYTLINQEDVHSLKLQVDHKNINYFPNSNIPITEITKDLGLNNFEETTSLLHETIPVMAYKQKQIENRLYYVPTTYRIPENMSLNLQIETILNHIDEKIEVLNSSVKNGKLTLELDSNILLDNEMIDKSLQERIILSLSSLKQISDVQIKINHEQLRTEKASTIQYNYIKI